MSHLQPRVGANWGDVVLKVKDVSNCSPASNGIPLSLMRMVQVFDKSYFETFTRELKAADSDERGRIKHTVGRMKKYEGRRFLSPLVPGVGKLLAQLKLDHPNFEEVTERVENRLALASLSGRLELGPILLNGAPGCGKTTYVKKLTMLLGTRFHQLNLASAQTGAVLAGADKFWANSKPGLVFTSLNEDEYANPVILLDEIDKTPKQQNDGDILGSLYPLLEQHSASRFCDNCFPSISVDASYITFIATSNDLTKLPEALLSRFEVFEIRELSEAEQSRVVLQMWGEMKEKEEATGLCNLELASETANAIASEAASPREMARLLKTAIGNCIISGRRRILPLDVVNRTAVKQSQRMGFF